MLSSCRANSLVSSLLSGCMSIVSISMWRLGALSCNTFASCRRKPQARIISNVFACWWVLSRPWSVYFANKAVCFPFISGRYSLRQIINLVQCEIDVSLFLSSFITLLISSSIKSVQKLLIFLLGFYSNCVKFFILQLIILCFLLTLQENSWQQQHGYARWFRATPNTNMTPWSPTTWSMTSSPRWRTFLKVCVLVQNWPGSCRLD